jgi:putative hemolysin
MSLIILSLIFLFGASLLKGISSAIDRLGKTRAEQLIEKKLLFVPLSRSLFSRKQRQKLSFALSLTRYLLSLGFALCFFTALIETGEPHTALQEVLFGVLTLGIALLCYAFFDLLATLWPLPFFKATSLLATLFLLPFWPLSLVLYHLHKKLLPGKTPALASFRIKDKILEIFQDAEFASAVDASDQKLILSVLGFKQRIVREVMVPRIDVSALSADTPLEEASFHFLKEGYSRIPVFKESIDNIIGVLYYKDILYAYAQQIDERALPVEKWVKPVLYTPETKKISHLLQEFRSKKIHLAIVVDEYGGTEGVVTIEDILEELVGEIADEYDVGEEALFTPLPSGGWIIDAKMTILDIEEELGIHIPLSPEYDTIGGYIFHKAGAIPSKGWRLHHDAFDLEVLSSDERSIDKIRVTLRK